MKREPRKYRKLVDDWQRHLRVMSEPVQMMMRGELAAVSSLCGPGAAMREDRLAAMREQEKRIAAAFGVPYQAPRKAYRRYSDVFTAHDDEAEPIDASGLRVLEGR